MQSSLSPRDLAIATGVSESSVKRWVDSGQLRAERTVGGHRRIAVSDALRFIRERELTPVQPALLGLPADPAAGDTLFEVLTGARPEALSGALLSLYVSGGSVAGIVDGALNTALTRVGELWRHDQGGIVTEHRATMACVQAIARLRALAPPPAADAPVAVGGARDGDPYLLPSMCAAAVLAEAGFRDVNLGPDTPAEVLGAAIRDYRPLLVWRPYTTTSAKAVAIRDDVEAVLEHARRAGATVVVGGRALDTLRVAPREGLHVASTMTELAGFACGLGAARSIAGRPGEDGAPRGNGAAAAGRRGRAP